jgi:hypothetical protein
MLEDLCLKSVEDDPATECVTAFLKCVADRCGIRPRPEPKARVHAWLASRQRPDRRLGEAAEAGEWPWSKESFAPLIAFLRGM